VAGFYVETIRNIPLLLQLLFWYNAVLKALPAVRDSLALPGGGFLNNRGLFLAQPVALPGAQWALLALAFGVVASIGFRFWARRRQDRTGQQAPVLWVAVGLIVVLPLVVLAASGFPVTFNYPRSGRFNIQGGIEVLPEFMALLFGLVIYTAAFIAEVVRAGIMAVARGQTEAAYSLGLRPGTTLRLVVVPQAMRVIVPPLTSQYLNLTKNSSLAVAIGYPDLVQIFAGTVLNQTGQAVEVIAITMAVYLTISLVTSGLMNLYNRHIALVDR
jgi:general L-amino acid transport system permease protein